MSAVSLLLVVIASITHAFWNFIVKKTNGGITFTWLVYTCSAIIFLPILIISQSDDKTLMSAEVLAICFISGILRLGYFVLLQNGYRISELSVVYPIARGSAPIFSTIGAILFLHENLTPQTVCGLILIICGVLIITNLNIFASEKILMRGLIFGCATGLMIGAYSVWDKIAISTYKISPFTLLFSSHILGTLLLAPKAMRKKRNLIVDIRNYYWQIIAIAILSPLSYLLILIAMKNTALIYIAPVREISILFGVWMGSQFMEERGLKKRVLGSFFILTGVIVMAYQN